MKLKFKTGSILFVLLVLLVMGMIVFYVSLEQDYRRQKYNSVQLENDQANAYKGIQVVIFNNCDNLSFDFISGSSLIVHTDNRRKEELLDFKRAQDTLFISPASIQKGDYASSDKYYERVRCSLPAAVKAVCINGGYAYIYGRNSGTSNENIYWYLHDASWNARYDYELNPSNNTEACYYAVHHIHAIESELIIENNKFIFKNLDIDLSKNSQLRMANFYENTGIEADTMTLSADESCIVSAQAKYLKDIKVKPE